MIAGAVVGFIDNSMDLIAEEYNLDFTSIIYYIDEETNQPVEMDRIHRKRKPRLGDIENIPRKLNQRFLLLLKTGGSAITKVLT